MEAPCISSALHIMSFLLGARLDFELRIRSYNHQHPPNKYLLLLLVVQRLYMFLSTVAADWKVDQLAD